MIFGNPPIHNFTSFQFYKSYKVINFLSWNAIFESIRNFTFKTKGFQSRTNCRLRYALKNLKSQFGQFQTP